MKKCVLKFILEYTIQEGRNFCRVKSRERAMHLHCLACYDFLIGSVHMK